MENLLEQLVDDLDYGFLCCGTDSRLPILYASESFYRMLGFHRGEITALLDGGSAPVLRNSPPIDWKRIVEEIEEKKFANPELRLIKKNGHHIWVSYRVTLEKKRDGGSCYCGLVEDITLKRRSRRQRLEEAQELQALTANVPCGVLRCRNDRSLTLNFVSDGFCRMTGYRREEIAALFDNRFIRMVYEEDRERLLRETQERAKKGSVAEVTYRIKGKNSRLIWALDKSRQQEGRNGNVWLYSVLMDVTEMHRTQEELAATEERYRMILEHAADPIVDVDLKTEQVYYSPVFKARFGSGLPHCEDLVKNLSKDPVICSKDRERILEWAACLLRGETTGDDEFRFREVCGCYIWCNVHPTVFFDEQGIATRLIAVVSDIDRRKKESIVLRQQAEHDLLTGLYNRMTVMDRIDQVLGKSRKVERHALFVIDIDNFKSVNDQLGHLKGDELIIETATQIKRLFRQKDIVGRIGGDEFVVLLRDIASMELIVKKAENIQNAFGRSGVSTNVGISGSIGVSLYPYDGYSYRELFRKADSAMYAAKRSGKNSFRVYTRETREIAGLAES